MKNQNVRAHILTQHKPSTVVDPWPTLETPSSIELPSACSLIDTPDVLAPPTVKMKKKYGRVLKHLTQSTYNYVLDYTHSRK